MTSAEQDDTPRTPNPTLLATTGAVDSGRAIEEAMALLDDLDDRPVADHVERFEAVHTALADALSKAESLMSGTNGNGG
jgi:hypothetical protein